MKKILTIGKKLQNPRIVYKTMCGFCGCEFEFESEDLKEQKKPIIGWVVVDCPQCGKELQRCPGTYNYKECEQ